jgi:hypothetical protein
MYKYTPIMTALGRCVGTLAIYLLVALVPLEASQPVHVHDGEHPGIYNVECSLVALAAFHCAAPLPSALVPVSAAPTTDPTFHSTATLLSSPLVPHPDPRAPPLA